MRLPKIAIENHQFSIMIIILLFLFGLVSFLTMPRSEDPQVNPPGCSVIVIYPGANPNDVEELIVEPIEEVINQLQDIKYLDSFARDGLGIVAVEFTAGSNPDEKYTDVVQKVNSIRSNLPEEIVSFDIHKWEISNVQIIQLALISETTSYRSLEYEADLLKKNLEKISGIKKVETWAFPQQEIRVSIDLEKMSLYHISLNQIFSAIQSSNKNIPGGSIDISGKRFNIQTSGSYNSINDIQYTIVHSHQGNIIYLKDIADIGFSYEELNYHARYDGKRAIFVTASQKDRTNIFNISKHIYDIYEKTKSQLPAAISLEIVFDQSKSVAQRLNHFFINLLQGLLLVGLLVFFTLGFRPSLIIVSVIPLAIVIGIGFVDLSKYGLQQMTIAGLVIVLGLLVDNAIVVTENISRFMAMGFERKDAAIKGTEQIGWAIVSATATTLLAFIPIIMMGDVTGDFIRSLPVTVIYTLSASLLLALILTPYLSFKYLKVENISFTGKIKRLINRFIETRYRSSLDYCLSRPTKIILYALFTFIFSLIIFYLFVGVSFFPKAEKPQIFINIDTPQGTNLQATDRIAKQVEAFLKRNKELKHYVTNIGHGNPQIYYNVGPKEKTANHAQILAHLDEYDPDKSQVLIQKLRSSFDHYPGVKIEVKELEQGPPVEAPVAIRILGENLTVLKEIALYTENIIKETAGTINVNNPLATTKTDLQIKINKNKAGMLGIPLVEINRTIRAAITGLIFSKFRDVNGKEYNIVVRLPFENKIELADLERIYISSLTGKQVPLSQIATVVFKAIPMHINHHNLERCATITADVITPFSVDQVTKKIIEKLDDYNWPRGYRYAIGGELESREESFGGMMKAVIIALIGIFAVLVLQFKSYSQPLIVFSAIPLAIVGSIMALLITGNSFSFTAFIGLTSLVGIVINNAIILVDYTNQLRREDMDIISALKEAGETRFMPIILTTATTIGGLLPLTIGGGSLWAPMGWTIIGGLTMSTFLTLLIVPVLYKLYTKNSSNTDEQKN
jgi:multidrug efflux pump subunit AcrB